ncbi:hypothetical protein ACFQZS_08750 [Mucilaginibacter calamicampi]|uniref:Membrane or secreted protein n=1 Tax=Mucilaginibacter calamicampi TaxID=1302352 RepID=A0ABW2Z0F3_9SPHI
MKTSFKIYTVALLAFSAITAFTSIKKSAIDSKDLKGAWEYGPAEKRTVMINTDKVFAVAVYDLPGKKFISSYGGTWQVNGNKLVQKIEWNNSNPQQVGTEVTTDITLAGKKLTTVTSKENWNKVDDGKGDDLTGAWVITGNYVNDKVTKRSSPFIPRRTMKVIAGGRFHWIAYNVQTKEFINAGGGNYSAKDGKYTEQIEFFTKTPESIGKSLSFQYSFVDGDWRHKGEKSTGGPLDECWTKREVLEK